MSGIDTWIRVAYADGWYDIWREWHACTLREERRRVGAVERERDRGMLIFS